MNTDINDKKPTTDNQCSGEVHFVLFHQPTCSQFEGNSKEALQFLDCLDGMRNVEEFSRLCQLH